MQLLRVPAHRTVMSKFIKVPSTQEMLGKYWLCPLDVGVTEPPPVDMGGCRQAPVPHTQHSSGSPQVFRDLNFTTGFSPFLLYSMLEESGEVTSAELEKAGEKGASASVWSR